MVPLGSSSCLIPDPVKARPFPSALTTMALGHSRRRWFGTCSCKPVPRGLPSSDKQLRATWPHGLSRSWRTIAGKPHLTPLSSNRTIVATRYMKAKLPTICQILPTELIETSSTKTNQPYSEIKHKLATVSALLAVPRFSSAQGNQS